MVIRQITLFTSIFLLYASPIIIPKIIWLSRSQKTSGIFSFEGKGSAGERIQLSYSFIHFKYGNRTIWFKGLGNMHLKEESVVPVRYQINDPEDAKVDTFYGIWGAVVVYGGEPLLILICIFFHRGIFPPKSKILITLKKPYLKVVK
ncbi:MAG TPA: hypothetical protein VK711_04695 [Puia sp.]|jgi:hypothetical protein|nr:hypothetical protein [Puia sp.]